MKTSKNISGSTGNTNDGRQNLHMTLAELHSKCDNMDKEKFRYFVKTNNIKTSKEGEQYIKEKLA